MIDFVILGAQKAATSTLQAALRAHPEITMPEGESALFEAPDFAARHWESLGPGDGARLMGIKRPDNLCTDLLIDRIAEALPEARFIVVLREPVSRAVSAYHHLVRHAFLPARPLNAGMARCLERYESGAPGIDGTVVRYGLYGTYLTKWFERLDPGQFLILSHAGVRSDPATALRAAAAHLGVDPEPLVAALADGQTRDQNVGLYDPAMLRLARFGTLLKTRPLPGTTRRAPRSVLPRALGTAITRLAEAQARRRGQQRTPLAPEIEARLVEIYAADLERLRPLVPPQTRYWDSEGP